MKKPLVGFIGQGWIGKNYADDFEDRGFEVVRYSLEEPYVQNGHKIKDCDIVFIAVPTPSTPDGFDVSILRKAIKNVGQGSTAVIKSTIVPGTCEDLQKEYPEIFIMHSPEFLTEATARQDAANPLRNIIGIPYENEEYQIRAKKVMDILPPAKHSRICHSRAAELIKYGGNNWFYFKVLYINLLYDLAKELGVEWEDVRDAMAADPRIGASHMMPVHKSGTAGGDAYQMKPEEDKSGGRGAGGHCFIKDFAAFHDLYKEKVGDEHGLRLLEAMRDKNIDLLVKSGKDLELLEGVYGEDVVDLRSF
jgi:UDP-glucose 6-dehydrogenase